MTSRHRLFKRKLKKMGLNFKANRKTMRTIICPSPQRGYDNSEFFRWYYDSNKKGAQYKSMGF